MSLAHRTASIVRWACIAMNWQWAWTHHSESIQLSGYEARAAAAND